MVNVLLRINDPVFYENSGEHFVTKKTSDLNVSCALPTIYFLFKLGVLISWESEAKVSRLHLLNYLPS